MERSGQRQSEHPDVVRVLAWIAAHLQEIADSAFWRAFRDSRSPRARLALLHRWATRKRGAPLTPGGARTTEPDNLRRLHVVAYLRADSRFDGLPACPRWEWSAIDAVTDALGWVGWQGSALQARYAAAKRRGDLTIWCAPEGLDVALDGFVAGVGATTRAAASFVGDGSGG